MFYVLDENKNLIEAYDKEGVLALLEQAIEDGDLSGIEADSAFVSKLKSLINGTTHHIEFITQAQYNAMEQGGTLVPNTYYYITDDTTAEDLENAINKIISGETKVGKASKLEGTANSLDFAEVGKLVHSGEGYQVAQEYGGYKENYIAVDLPAAQFDPDQGQGQGLRGYMFHHEAKDDIKQAFGLAYLGKLVLKSETSDNINIENTFYGEAESAKNAKKIANETGSVSNNVLSIGGKAVYRRKSIWSGSWILGNTRDVGNTKTLSEAVSAGDILQIEYVPKYTSLITDTEEVIFAKVFNINTSETGIRLTSVIGGNAKSSGFTATCDNFSISNTTIMYKGGYYLLNFANNGGTLLEDNEIKILNIYKLYL